MGLRVLVAQLLLVNFLSLARQACVKDRVIRFDKTVDIDCDAETFRLPSNVVWVLHVSLSLDNKSRHPFERLAFLQQKNGILAGFAQKNDTQGVWDIKLPPLSLVSKQLQLDTVNRPYMKIRATRPVQPEEKEAGKRATYLCRIKYAISPKKGTKWLKQRIALVPF